MAGLRTSLRLMLVMVLNGDMVSFIVFYGPDRVGCNIKRILQRVMD